MQSFKGRSAIIYGRFSSKQQKNSLSRQRQVEQAIAFVSKHEMKLIEGGVWFDAGVSGYRGKHRQQGELGKLLDGIQSGVVPPDTVLIVESIDRLSRENPLEAIGLIKDIIDNGITVYTLHDNQLYDRDRMHRDQSAIFLLIAGMQRAHSEAEARSERSKASWAYKRDMVRKGKVPRMKRPFWIDQHGQLLPKRTAVVRRIFNHYIAERMGIAPIAQALNADKVPTPTDRAAEWRFSQVARILKDPRTLGLFGAEQLYPAAIERSTFGEAQRILDNKRYKGAVRKGWTSALKGISTCQKCGGALRIHSSRKTSRTMYCRRRMEGVCDTSGGVNYKLALLFTVWATAQDMAHTEAQNKPSNTGRRDLTPEITAVEKEIDQLVELGAMTGNLEQIASKIRERQQKKSELISELEQQLLTIEHDLFTEQMEWLLHEMPKMVGEALTEDCRIAAQRLNQYLSEAEAKITWDGLQLRVGDYTAKRDYKRLIIEGHGVIQQANEGTQELGGGWWFLAKRS